MATQSPLAPTHFAYPYRAATASEENLFSGVSLQSRWGCGIVPAAPDVPTATTPWTEALSLLADPEPWMASASSQWKHPRPAFAPGACLCSDQPTLPLLPGPPIPGPPPLHGTPSLLSLS
ncbi:hypothetical protein QYE76_057968 [Lolium multiflorum]|uniref:Uncharacterized protein n=1 Tax=Lolium multiflorum TaxID=4521 RepID=A0AAD8T5N9_LOLMU|nr:hypothetical protein QYE76_057968 [Lolium multiflorum]